MKIKLLILSLVFVACSEAQILPTCHFDATIGNTTFTMTDIPGENLAYPLFITWDVPQGKDLPLLVFIHAWNSGAGIDFDTAAIRYLHNQGIAVLAIGMRGRNTGLNGVNDIATMETLRDAGGLETYDAYKSIQYFINSIVGDGHIDKTKISVYAISGGGSSAAGLANKFPGLTSTQIIWYGVTKMGSYASDPNPTVTGWYTDNSFYYGKIQGAVGGVGKGGPGYIAGETDEYYASRDNHTGVGNSTNTKFHLYHDSGDLTVFDDLSDALSAKLASNGQAYEYHHSTDGSFGHDKADLLTGKFKISPQFGLDWVSDVKTINRSEIPNSGTLRVNGYLIPVDYAMNPKFEYWIKLNRKNNPAVPASQSRANQGKEGSAMVTYNLANNTFKTYLIKGNSTVGNQFHYVDIKKGSDNVIALLATTDTVTLKPTQWDLKPENITANWRAYLDFSNPDYYLNDETGKVSNAFDLTGNKNIAFQQVKTARQSVTGSYITNPVMFFAAPSGPLAYPNESFSTTGEFTFIISFDPDQTSITSYSEIIAGANPASIQFTNWSGRIIPNVVFANSTYASDYTKNNADLGKQVWAFRRDAAGLVTAKCLNSTASLSYSMGVNTASFDLKSIGSNNNVKKFTGKIYKTAYAKSALSDADITTILTAWYNGGSL